MATKLGQKTVGDIVKLKVSGTLTDFIIVHQGNPDANIYDASCNGTWLLMKDCWEQKRWHSSNDNKYADSEINSYLNGTFLGLFEANIQAAIKQVKIPYHTGTSGSLMTGSNGLSCKIFLLGGREVGWILETNHDLPADGAKLDYFIAGNDSAAYQKRATNFKGSAADGQWLRSPVLVSSDEVWAINISGACIYCDCIKTIHIRPALILPSDLSVSDDGTVIPNTAPTTPAGITVPETIQGGTTISLRWEASTDAENNLAGYYVEKSVDGGSGWSRIYQGTLTSTTDTVAFGTPTVMYRVKAYDTEGLESGWKVSSNVTVVNNRAPTAPGSITVPVTVNGGAPLTVTWTAATDSDGNLSGYELERQHDSTGWERVYKGPLLSFTETVTKGWQNIQYRVRAYDDLEVTGPYATSDVRTVNNNTAPAVTCADHPSGSDLGQKNEPFSIQYSVDDADSDTVTVTEAIDGAQLRSFQAELKKQETCNVDAGTYQRILNGQHTLTITADDGKAQTVHSLTFSKLITAASVTLETPMEADAEITLAILSVSGSIPADAVLKVEVTNNGKDPEPAWQDVTAEVKSGTNIVFTNHTAAQGFAFNFKVSVSRGLSNAGGYITSIQGGFQ